MRNDRRSSAGERALADASEMHADTPHRRMDPAANPSEPWYAMTESTVRFDAESVREAWDHAADAFVEGQTSGRDYYRLDFLGPAQVDACGDVRGARLLDVGCGGGYLARELAARGARVTGIDISPRMIEHARRMEDDAPLGIDYHAMDAAEIAARFPAESFDMAASCVALQDMPEPAAALRAVRGGQAQERGGRRLWGHGALAVHDRPGKSRGRSVGGRVVADDEPAGQHPGPAAVVPPFC